MSDSAQTVPPQSEPADSPTPWKPLPVEKLPPRPAPTEAYSWREYNPNARRIYIRDHHQANVELARLCLWDDVLGFDLEWKPNFVKGGRENRTALVQLANRDNILLVQISAMQEFPIQLRLLLENPGIVKCGVAIQSDAKKIFNDFRLSVRSCVDLSLLARTVDNARWRGKYNSSLGLAHLVESYEYRMLLKGKITRTNWERVLDLDQQEYASNDAHAAYVLYRKLANMVPSMASPPEPVWYSFNAVGGSFLTPEGKPWQAQNPSYDPGPSPPPRDDKNDRKSKRKADGDVIPEQPDGAEPNKLLRWQPGAQHPQQAINPPVVKPLHPFSVKGPAQPVVINGFKTVPGGDSSGWRLRQPAQPTSGSSSNPGSNFTSAQRPFNAPNASRHMNTQKPGDRVTITGTNERVSRPRYDPTKLPSSSSHALASHPRATQAANSPASIPQDAPPPHKKRTRTKRKKQGSNSAPPNPTNAS